VRLSLSGSGAVSITLHLLSVFKLPKSHRDSTDRCCCQLQCVNKVQQSISLSTGGQYYRICSAMIWYASGCAGRNLLLLAAQVVLMTREGWAPASATRMASWLPFDILMNQTHHIMTHLTFCVLSWDGACPGHCRISSWLLRGPLGTHQLPAGLHLKAVLCCR